MLVVEDQKVILLKLAKPERVMSAIPTAKKLEFNGSTFTVIPHRLDEVRVLRNLGIRAPSPILSQYKWPGRFTPFNHQRMTSAFLTMHNKCVVLNEIGTGKTQAALWAADYLIKKRVIKKVLILSPLSTLERVWGDSIFEGLIHRKAVVLTGTAERRKKLLKSEADFYVINHDGFNIIAKESIGMFDLVIVDEAAVYRNPTTTRFKTFFKWMGLNPQTRLWLMTGTPTPNEPTDAWALAKLINSADLTSNFTNFKEQVMYKVGNFRYIPRVDAAEIVSQVLRPSVRYTRDECLDLPDQTFQSREVALSSEQRFHYEKMLKQFTTELATGSITAVNEAVKLGKLVQIACGVAYGDNGNEFEIDASPRLALLKEVIEEIGGKCIVFVPLTGALHMVARYLRQYYTVEVVNGQVKPKERNEIFNNFQHGKEPKILLAHPGTMAHGLTLTAAKATIWYGPTNSNETYTQANGRTERIGKRYASTVVHLQGTTLEREMYARLKGKQTLQGLLLSILQQQDR